MKSRLVVLALLVLLVASVATAGCGGKSQVSEKEKKPIQLGVLMATTGDFAPGEEYSINATKLAVDEINTSGGVNGRKINIVFEDTASKPASAMSAFQKMMSQNPDIIAVSGSELSAISIPMLPLIAQNKVAYMAGATNVKIHNLPDWSKYYYRTVAHDGINASLTVKYLVEKKGLKKFAIIYDTDEFGVGGMNAIKAELKKYNIDPLTVQAYTIGDKDFTGQLMAIKKSGAEALLGWSHPTEAGLIVKQLVEVGLDSQIKTVMGSYYAHPTVVELAGKYSNKIDVLSVTDNSPGNSDAKVQEFVKKYKDKYGKFPDRTAMHNYDKVYMIAEAIKKLEAANKPVTRDNVREVLSSFKDFKGVMTTYSFDDKNNSVWSGVVVRMDPSGPGGLKYLEGISFK